MLNSPQPEVVENSVKELEYHAAFLDALGVDNTHKVVIHLGGIYNDKAQSLKDLFRPAGISIAELKPGL